MRINSIGTMPQNNLISNQSNEKVTFRGFTSSISVDEFEQAAKALKGKKGWSFVDDELITKATARFKELTAKLQERFGNDSDVDLQLQLHNQKLAASLYPGKSITDTDPAAVFNTFFQRHENNSMFAEHGVFLQKIEEEAKEITPELCRFFS